MYLKPVYYLTKATLSPQKSQKQEKWKLQAFRTFPSLSSQMAHTWSGSSAARDESVPLAEELSDEATAKETSDRYEKQTGTGKGKEEKLCRQSTFFHTTRCYFNILTLSWALKNSAVLRLRLLTVPRELSHTGGKTSMFTVITSQ